jgi:hypothetical protein
MGLLDDAIREHLDLKRRRGADPAEIERAEREALGPVRRGPEEPPDIPTGTQPEAAAAAADAPADTFDDSLIGSEPAFEDDVAEEEAAYEHEVGYDEEEYEDEDEFEWHAAPGPPSTAASEPPAPANHAPARHDPAPTASHGGDETVEYDVERAFANEGQPETEDVLEETPEFLQDTPDHDRLWFEQRPPRDFDFDG